MQEACEPGADVTLAINQVSGWIAAADTKAGLLAASLGVLVAGLLTQAGPLRTMAPPHTVREALILVLAHLVMVAVAVSGWFILRTLAPKSTTSRPTRYGWPTLARRIGAPEPSPEPSPGPDPDGDNGRARAEAWQHAIDLAVIAQRKFVAFRAALAWATVAGGTLLSLLIVTLWA
ncbi:hypothetical protein AB0H86_17410 [Streptomyces sp. NPDC050997]|uniref:hypothetical protein n=1 Tax=Streptomyces sp. NPDC050997 TaxID=3155519 RepID=UPI003429437C